MFQHHLDSIPVKLHRTRLGFPDFLPFSYHSDNDTGRCLLKRSWLTKLHWEIKNRREDEERQPAVSEFCHWEQNLEQEFSNGNVEPGKKKQARIIKNNRWDIMEEIK